MKKLLLENQLGKKGMGLNMLAGKKSINSDMLGGKKGFSMALSAAPSSSPSDAPSVSNAPSMAPSAAPSSSSAPSSSPSDEGTCDSAVAEYYLSTGTTDFAGAMNLTPGRPQCTLTPVADNAELQKILKLVDPLPGGSTTSSAWVGIFNAGQTGSDTTNLLEGWTNVNDGSAVPAFDNLWRRNEPNNSPGPQQCAHVFGTQGDNSQTKLAGYLRDVSCTSQSFRAVYKCCDGMGNPFS